MPWSHSALCTALTTSVALCCSVVDSLFPVCLGFSLIVMYDAFGVLNIVVEYLFEGHPISQKKLKEFLGHTPSQAWPDKSLYINSSFNSGDTMVQKVDDSNVILPLAKPIPGLLTN
ncbi:hypothetical protein D8674_031302 [Pyrus ussuriensis x Pyrus communis]|uniref:Uncharacterized protein n=1 Tax=Pyrus ussuriensis x Pyrus communis TaxID=2448454 RepID=A0A5N5F3K5_9ROSA|nr:hypothetical protein D8674_031302 [Pyrus ussuriensis x Pyrus communis]